MAMTRVRGGKALDVCNIIAELLRDEALAVVGGLHAVLTPA